MSAGSTEETLAAVVFDYGGVLTGPVRESIGAWLAADRIDPKSFSATLKAWLGREASPGSPVHQLETGELAAEQFEAEFAAALTGADGQAIAPLGILARMFAGLRPEPDMFALVQELRADGVVVGLLSNSWGTTYPRERIDELFDVVVVSSEVGLRKPDAAIYELALSRLGVPAGRVLFLDDAEPNVIGARNVGMHAALHVDPVSTRALIADHFPDLGQHSTGVTA